MSNFRAALRSVAEKKYFDQPYNFGISSGVLTYKSFSSEGVCLSLTDVDRATTDTTRIGDKCTGTSLQYKFFVFNPTSVAYPDCVTEFMFRIIIFIWKDDTDPIPAELVQYVYPLTSRYPTQPLHHDLKVKRKILLDKTYTTACDRNLTTSWYSGMHNYPVFGRGVIPLTKLKGGLSVINFQNGSIQGINKIWLYVSTNVPAVLENNSWQMTFSARYNFVDV